MAFKHRKLFPTMECPPLCDLDCQYRFRCHPNQNPYLYYSPPPPPPLSYIHKDPPISPFVIIMITVLSSLFLLVSYYAIIVKHCGDCTRSDATRSPSDERDEEQRLDENQGPVIDHPIWFITTVGLHEAIINSITVCKYKKGEGLIEGTDCSVCLSEFQEGETLRLLPKCNHAFHTHCIDTWLSTHTNCPLCRARIVSETVSSNTASAELNSQNLSANEETQMVNYQGDVELSETQARSSGFGENRAGTEDACEQQQVDEDDNRRSKEAVNSTNENNGVFQVPRTSIDNHHQSTEDDEEIQQLKRSISMDSSSTTSICVGQEKIHSEGSSGNPKLEARESTSDIVPKGSDMDTNEETLQNSPVSVKRSLSNGGGKSFWPRHNRCPNSILPL